MTKGRRFVPSSANEGNWFRHRGALTGEAISLGNMTSTRAMLAAPFSAPVGPRTPPEPFLAKEKDIFKQDYPFTQHDNRHYFQEHGVYFGDGKETRNLGRRLHAIDRRLHHTDRSHLHHLCRNPTLFDYNPTMSTSYRSPVTTVQPIHRRFPRVYKTPETSDLSTTTTLWPNIEYKTPMQVLASSQEPFLGHNNWKYSHHGLTRIYPSYNYNRKAVVRTVPNILDRYGADFASVPVPPFQE